MLKKVKLLKKKDKKYFNDPEIVKTIKKSIKPLNNSKTYKIPLILGTNGCFKKKTVKLKLLSREMSTATKVPPR